MTVPIPTPIYRFLHVDSLPACLERRALHAPNHTPANGLAYRTIHNVEIQEERRVRSVPCGPGGVIHDYVSFYFGPRSPMLFQLHTGRVQDYTEGQDPLVYLVSTAQTVHEGGVRFVFSDGHGIATFTCWYDDFEHLDKVDWDAVQAKIWRDTVDDMDRQRRKQAEFLVHRQCDWSLIREIAVLNGSMKTKVEQILEGYDPSLHRPVSIRPAWYY